jgi:hypothetical protein
LPDAMKRYRMLRLLLTFYKSYAAVALLITLSCSWIFWINGLKSFVFIFWFKIITLALIACFISTYKKKEFFYYQNLGLSKLQLWSYTLTADMLIYIAVLTLTYRLQ